MTDWIKGMPHTALRFELPSGYAINVNISQHRSGKVIVYQSISKLIGGFNDLMNGTLDFSCYSYFIAKLIRHIRYIRK